MNSNVRDTGFAGLPEIEGMRYADVFNLFIVEILPLNEFQNEFDRSYQRTLPMSSELFRRMDECRSRPDELSAIQDVLNKVANQLMFQVVDKVERSLQSNNDKEDMNSELPKSLLDKFRDFNMVTHNLGIRVLKAIFRHMSGPKEIGA